MRYLARLSWPVSILDSWAVQGKAELRCNRKSNRKPNVHNSGDVLSFVEAGEVEEMLAGCRKAECNARLLGSVLGLDCFSLTALEMAFECSSGSCPVKTSDLGGFWG